MQARQRAAALADRGPHRLNNHRSAHGSTFLARQLMSIVERVSHFGIGDRSRGEGKMVESN
jgi:hypothetical protein